MATATIVKAITNIGDPKQECNLYTVELEDGQKFKVMPGNLEDNYAVIVKAYSGTPLVEIAEIVAGCFTSKSNFFTIISQCFKCDRTIKLEYNHVSVLVYHNKVNAESIVRAWKKNEKRLYEGIYYIIGVRKLRPKGKYDGICMVLASSEEGAIRKAKRGYQSCECVCFGKYNKKDNTFTLKNADKHLEFEKMCKIEY